MTPAVPVRPDHLPDYNDPPLREVAVGVHFEPIRGLRQAHFGLLWQRFRDQYPKSEDRDALPLHVESYDEEPAPPAFEFVITDSPPLHRTWFISSDEESLIQLQSDRLVHNWRHQGGGYPHFEPLLDSFERAYGHLEEVLAESGVAPPTRTHVEVTYVNWIAAADLGGVLRGFTPILVDASGVGPLPERAHLALRYPVSAGGMQVGRLYVETAPVVQVTPDETLRGYRLVLTFRAPSGAAELAADLRLLERGREAIVEVFTALTHESDHQRWGRFK
jgi:uncharacterized protein (TIGR04255 family)